MNRPLLAALASVCTWASAQAQDLSSQELTRRTVERRAIEAVIWGMPAVNAELMFQAMRDAKADFNQVVYWSRPVSWKNQTLTPNPDTIYLMPFFNTKDAGPMVLEIPPVDGESSITGSIDEALADGDRRCRAGRRGQGEGREVPHPAAGLQGTGARGLHRAALGNVRWLRAAALQPQDCRRSRHRQGGRIRKARPVLSALAGGESTGDKVRRCARRRIRQHHSATTCAFSGSSTASCSASHG